MDLDDFVVKATKPTEITDMRGPIVTRDSAWSMRCAGSPVSLALLGHPRTLEHGDVVTLVSTATGWKERSMPRRLAIVRKG